MARVAVTGGQKTTDSPRSHPGGGGAGGQHHVPDGINITGNEGKLLYLLSRYASAAPEGALAAGAGSVERWLRRVPLLVLVYEGITKQAFDYEFSPCLERVGVGSLWLHLNVAHEAATDLTRLCEAGLVNEIRLCSLKTLRELLQQSKDEKSCAARRC